MHFGEHLEDLCVWVKTTGAGDIIAAIEATLA